MDGRVEREDGEVCAEYGRIPPSQAGIRIGRDKATTKLHSHILEAQASFPPAHLQVASCFSLLRGTARIPELIGAAKERGFDALALTDLNGIYGAIEFYKKAKDAGIKPIIGVTLDEAQDEIEANPNGNKNRKATPKRTLTILAKNRRGYGEICRLITKRKLDKNFKLAEIAPDAVANSVLITLSPELLEELAPHFSLKELYGGILPPIDTEGTMQARAMFMTAKRLRRKIVAVNDVHFLNPAEQSTHRLLRAIDENETIYTVSGVVSRARYLMSAEEMRRAFADFPEALIATREIAEECNLEFELGKWVFPHFPLPPGVTAEERLRKLCLEGLNRRYPKLARTHFERLNYELSVIEKLGYAGYLLAVQDIVQEANRRGIPNLGRGSAANSLVCYALFLTHVDPLKYNLYFERFLNPERTSPPDLDIDFNWKRRDEIIEYVYQKYGSERVAMVSTHITFQARSALRETAKAMGILTSEVERVLRRIPFFSGAEVIDNLAERYPECKDIDLSAPEYQTLISQAKKIGGLPRHLGIHVGGIVIAPQHICDFTALERSAKGFVVTQNEMFGIEDIGLIKIDLLGNRSLGVLEDTLSALRARGINPPIDDFDKITRDEKTVQLIREGKTMGCFYIESPGMRQLLRKLRTETFEELTAASSIIRPGVAESGMMQEYIKRHREPESVEYLHPKLKEILGETYGVMVYQEDVIRVAHELAGMSLAEADLLRRAMSGKLRSAEAMAGVRDKFLKRCADNGINPFVAFELWRQIRSFAGYSFCKAHSAAFAVLSFQVAYLKAHYPAFFMAQVMANHGGFYATGAYIQECRRLGLNVLLPHVNKSEKEFTAEDERTIRVGLAEIGEVAESTIDAILKERARGGLFASFVDLIRRTPARLSDLEVLIKVGACDGLGFTRPQMMALLKSEFAVNHNGGEFLPLDDAREIEARARSLPAFPDYDLATRIKYEMKYLGFAVSAHPLVLFAPYAGDVVNASEMHKHIGKRVRMLGWCIAEKRVDIARRQKARDAGKIAVESAWLSGNGNGNGAELANGNGNETWNGNGNTQAERLSSAVELGILSAHSKGTVGVTSRDSSRVLSGVPRERAMKFLSLEDLTGAYEAVLFPEAYEKYAHLTGQAGPFILTGRAENDNGVVTLNVETLELANVTAGSPKILTQVA